MVAPQLSSGRAARQPRSARFARCALLFVAAMVAYAGIFVVVGMAHTTTSHGAQRTSGFTRGGIPLPPIEDVDPGIVGSADAWDEAAADVASQALSDEVEAVMASAAAELASEATVRSGGAAAAARETSIEERERQHEAAAAVGAAEAAAAASGASAFARRPNSSTAVTTNASAEELVRTHVERDLVLDETAKEVEARDARELVLLTAEVYTHTHTHTHTHIYIYIYIYMYMYI